MQISVDNASVEQLVDHHIKLAVGEALAKQTPYLVQQVVEAALTRPMLDSYNRPITRNGRNVTVVDNAVTKLIQEAAQEAVKEWAEEQKPEIKRQVAALLNNKKKGLIAQAVEQLATKFAQEVNVSVWFKKD